MLKILKLRKESDVWKFFAFGLRFGFRKYDPSESIFPIVIVDFISLITRQFSEINYQGGG